MNCSDVTQWANAFAIVSVSVGFAFFMIFMAVLCWKSK